MTDIVGPLPRSKRGNIYILTVQDAFTKWPDAYPLRNQRAKTVARTLFHRWIATHGCPDTLHSDQGRNFESKLLKELLKILQIRKTRTTAYHPSGNGQVESFNRTLKNILRCCLHEAPAGDDWEDHLPTSLMAYRSSVHRGTGYTPHFLVFGREMKLPPDLVYEAPQGSTDPPGHVEALRRRLLTAHRATRDSLDSYQRLQKVTHDHYTRGDPIAEGDQVFIYNPALKPGEASKFHIFWRGPVRVVERISDLLFRVQNPRNRARTKVVHFNNLKKFREAEKGEAAAPPAEPSCEDEDSEPLCPDARNIQRRIASPPPSHGAPSVASTSPEDFEAPEEHQTEEPEESLPSQAVDPAPRRVLPTRNRRPPNRYGQSA
jgi:hypothetical protein